MFPENIFNLPLRTCRHHVLLTHFIKLNEFFLSAWSEPQSRLITVASTGSVDMPQIIGDFLIPRQRIKVSVETESRAEEQVEIAAAREEDNQQDGKQKAGMA